MRKEIEGKLIDLQIVAKETRKTKIKHILIATPIIVGVFLVVFIVPQLSSFGSIGLTIGIIIGYFIASQLFVLYQPLDRELYAFKKFTLAIEILEKSKEEVAYEEAYRHVKKAYKSLKKVELTESVWYDWANEVFENFMKNLKLIIIPAVNEGTIKIDDLEEIALALYERDPVVLNTVNDRIESESAYKKSIVRVTSVKKSVRVKLKESRIGKICASVAFGYFFILIICVLYVALTQQDFMTFARERPDIIITGGLLASGITSVTIWKIR